MRNKRITQKEYNLIKGSLRRVFARSELRAEIIKTCLLPDNAVPEKIRLERKRVKNWAKCPVCKEFTAKSYMQADHISPVIPLDKSLNDLDIYELLDRIWCEPSNLVPICKDCHKLKTKAETKIRAANKRLKKLDIKNQKK